MKAVDAALDGRDRVMTAIRSLGAERRAAKQALGEAQAESEPAPAPEL